MSFSSLFSLCGLCRLLCLVLILRTTYGTDLDNHDGIHNLPKTTLAQLSEFLDGKLIDESFLRDTGGRLGVFVVTNLGPEYSEAVESFRALAPKCLEHFDSQLPVAKMADGSTRRTYATQDKIYPGCLAKSLKTMSTMYDKVETKVTRLIQKFSEHATNLSYIENGKTVQLQAAPIKDHLHVYTQAGTKQMSKHADDFLVPYHIDNGLFLLLTPFPSPSLLVRLSNGKSISTNGLGSDSILVLMGRGLTEWLFQDQRTDFFPVPHAVPALTGSSAAKRAVYARMKVAPMDAIPATHSLKNHVKFSEIFFDNAPSAKSSKLSEDLCTGSVTEMAHGQMRSTRQTPISAAPFLEANALNCVNNTAYCWMNCLELPKGCSLEESECYNSEHHTCNTINDDPPHDVTCAWHCKSPNTSTTLKPGPDTDDSFCGGGMDMLMGGFEVAGGSNSVNTKTCVILFFKAWKLNSAAKFAAACIGVFVLGFCIEALITLRRKIVNRKRIFVNIPLPARKGLVIFLFGVNLILGYLAMLVAMTYSVELFLCVVAGLILGHAIFNSHMPIGETIDPCCASQNHNESSGDHSPLGRTPCDNVVYQEMATNGAEAGNDGDAQSLCHCDDANSNTNIKV